MTYTPKSDKQCKRYKSIAKTHAENDTCSLFHSYLCSQLSKIYEINLFKKTRLDKLSRKKESLKTDVGHEGHGQNKLEPSVAQKTRLGSKLTMLLNFSSL